MTLLDADIQLLFGEVFGSFYLDGTLTTNTRVSDGMGGGSVTAASQPIKLQVDACTDRQKLEEGYSAKDVRIIVLQSGLSDRIVPSSQISDPWRTWRVGPVVTEDPARSYFECRGIPV